MGNTKKSTGLLFLLLSGLFSFAQNFSNKGKEFWVGYGHHQFFELASQNNTQNMVLYLSADQAATVTVSVNGTGYSNTYSVAANSVIVTDPIPKSGVNDARLFVGASGFTGAFSEGISNRGIHIVSDVPIVAYAHIYGSVSSGATMLMPVETYGYSYVSLNSQQRFTGSPDCFSWVYVIAKENNTRVEITPAAPTRGGKPANVPFVVNLNKGQIYQLMGATISGNTAYDMTGTTVKSIPNAAGSCYPIAVFSGSSRTYITCSGTGGAGGDNIIQQVFPFQAWGKRYLTSPTSNSSSADVLMTNPYRVAVKDPSTVVKRNGVPLTGLVNNLYYEFQSGTADFIEADKPIMVAQYLPSNGGCPGAAGLGDPEMIYISPIEQSIKRVGFYRNDEESILVNYLTLIIPTNGLLSLSIDGSSSVDYSYPHPNFPGYSVAVKRWTASSTQCIVQSDSAFTSITYGLGNAESYGYNAGTLINNLNVFGSVSNTLGGSGGQQYTCRNTPVNISVLLAYQPTQMDWLLSQVPSLSPNADITINNPVPVGTQVVGGTVFYKYDLPGTYTFNTAGTIEIPVRNKHSSIENCDNSEIVKFTLEIRPTLKAEFDYTHTGCSLDTIRFSSPAGNSNGYTITSWNWNFGNGIQATGQNPVKVLPPGDHTVNLQVVSTEGCVGDSTRTITVYAPPTTALTASAAVACQGNSVSLTAASSYSGLSDLNGWYWDFGNSTNLQAPNGNPQTITYPAPGEYTVKHVVKASELCISDTAIQIIKVFAKPQLSLSFPAGCLPVDGNVQFVNTTSVADGQPLSYAWNFGDAAATPGNPNTSTEQNPSHVYAYGTYTISLSVSTPSGCSKDTSFSTTFNVKPLLAYNGLPSICENIASVSVATANVTNGVPGTSVYRGPGTDASGVFRPGQAGPGIHTIWYVFTSNGGCKDSVSSTIRVYPKPLAAFTASNDICLNEQASFNSTASITEGSVVSWNWNFGDGNLQSYSNGNGFTRNYTAWNNYTVKLATVSDQGCISDTAVQIVGVHPLPVVSFTLPTSVCMPGGAAAFTSQTTVADNSSLSYEWAFGDGNSGSGATPSHVYTTAQPYQVVLKATSQYGCVNESQQTFNAFFNKPIAAFSVAPDTLCQGTNNEFTDLSSDPLSPIQAWNWSFGDGGVSTSAEPVKKYSQPGNYTVTLTVRNAAGCTSDPFKDTVIVYLQPVIDAGPSFIVPEGTPVRFNPRANDSATLSFLWTPSANFADATLLRPTINALQNQTYTLTATGLGNCTASDELTVKILKPVNIPNSFTPNGDGINDTWIIPNLADYPGCKVEVFNRYGQPVYQSSGYGTPWNGTHKGNTLPFGTYYYVVTLKNGFAPITGSVTIVK
ncbi:MAG TPA: PKD domain-containing protein [Flavisolibacter sp.]|nr:PKD domain-containing protein [Flavisolibacter sp.]